MIRRSWVIRAVPAISEVRTPLSRVCTDPGFGCEAGGSWPLAGCGENVLVVPSGALGSVIALLLPYGSGSLMSLAGSLAHLGSTRPLAAVSRCLP
jgi:hypothetical protein